MAANSSSWIVPPGMPSGSGSARAGLGAARISTATAISASNRRIGLILLPGDGGWPATAYREPRKLHSAGTVPPGETGQSRTTILPVLSPRSIPRKASGVWSIPSTTVWSMRIRPAQPLRHLRAEVRQALRVVADEEAAQGQPLADHERQVGRAGRLPAVVVHRDGAAHRDPAA